MKLRDARSHTKKSLNLMWLCLVLITSLFVPGCGGAQITQNTPFLSEKTNEDQYAYASHLDLDQQTLENLLTIKENNKEYKLIPAGKYTKDENYWTNLVTNDENYIQTFFLNRKALTKIQAVLEYRNAINIMWNNKLPDELFFIATLNGDYAGILKCSGLSSGEDVTIGYVTAKEYAGQGVATNSLKMFVELIKHLNKNEFCSVKKLLLWIFDDNPASIAVAQKNGFTCDEKDAENERSRYSLDI